MIETWHEIPLPGYDHLYEASDCGRVRSRDRIDRFMRLHRGVVFTPFRSPTGYLQVTLSNNGRQWTFTIHDLIARTWLGERPKGYEVNHLNGDKVDNRAENLEYVSRSANQHHRYHVLGKRAPHGEAHYAARLSDADVTEIRRL